MDTKITFALPKGRLAEDSLKLLKDAGLTDFAFPDKTRELIFDDEATGFRFLLVRAADVGTYVSHGVADIGIVGKDVLDENRYPVYELLDLGFGYCRLAIAAPSGSKNILDKSWLRVASKYTHLAEDFFHGRGLNASIVKLYGSVEIAPLLGMADCIVDLVSTGATLKANGLEEIETIMESTARLIVSKPALGLYSERIKHVTETLRSHLS